MSRPTKLLIQPSALLHNVTEVKRHAPGKKIIAMVKANAYGCGLDIVGQTLEGHVDAFGVACIEEALMVRKLGMRTECIIFQGIFQPEKLFQVAEHHFSLVIHQARQLQWLVNTPLSNALKIWVKVNTGMNRLGFKINELQEVMNALQNCPWVNKDIGLMSHLACADEPNRVENSEQIAKFQQINIPGFTQRSFANSAAILALKQAHEDVVRPGIMLYGISPLSNKSANELGLKPVMHLMSAITAIQTIPAFAKVGYTAAWQCDKPSVIGIVAAGYGDGYPRHVSKDTKVWIKGYEVPIIGIISMDSMAVNLTGFKEITLGDPVELWGANMSIDRIAKSAGTIPYELICQIPNRVRQVL